MARKHGEVTRRLSRGWTLAWDSTHVDPIMRKATDKIVDEHVAALRAQLGDAYTDVLADDRPGPRRSARRRAAAA